MIHIHITDILFAKVHNKKTILQQHMIAEQQRNNKLH